MPKPPKKGPSNGHNKFSAGKFSKFGKPAGKYEKPFERRANKSNTGPEATPSSDGGRPPYIRRGDAAPKKPFAKKPSEEAPRSESSYESVPERKPFVKRAASKPAAPAQETPRPESPRGEESRPEPEAPMAVAAAPAEEPAGDGFAAFAELGLAEPIARAIRDLGFEAPTPIQARSIPILLEGHDLVGLAQTGTGKTAAFALPMLCKLDSSRNEVQGLVMAPTRELAIQVAGGIHSFAKHTGLRVVPVYGGQPIDRQLRALRAGAHIVVGTPGRIMDHLRRGSLSFANVSFCALDEADEMLALGFQEDIEAILAELPEERQLAFFSATMPARIAQMTKKFLRDPRQVAIEAKKRTVETTNQAYYEVPRGKKMEALARVLDMETPGATIVFCRTRQDTQNLAEELAVRGYAAEPIHGDMGQTERDRVMKRFREGTVELLIATDVAARGLDIETVTHVINYDIPWDVEQYIHRIGRTGRAGRSGDAITLVEPKEKRMLKNIERMIGATIKPARIPTAADISARRREKFAESIRTALQTGGFESYLRIVEEMTDEFDPTEIAAAALGMLWQTQHTDEPTPAQEFDEVKTDRPEVGMARLFLGIGRFDGLRPGDVVGAISNEAGIPGKSIGAIDILDRVTFVEVPEAEAENVIAALGRTQLRRRKVKVSLAKPHDEQ